MARMWAARLLDACTAITGIPIVWKVGHAELRVHRPCRSRGSPLKAGFALSRLDGLRFAALTVAGEGFYAA